MPHYLQQKCIWKHSYIFQPGFSKKGWNFLPLRFLELTENGHDDFSTWEMVKSVPVTISRKQEKVLEVPESENY